MNFLYIFSPYLPFQPYLHPFHKEGNIWRYLSSNWSGLFNRRTRCQIEKGLTVRGRLPAFMIDRRAKACLKGEKLQVLRLHLEENLWIRSYKLCNKCKPKWQRQANESLFEQHSRTFAPLHPTPDDQISVLAYRQLQKRERTGKEYGCFPFVWKTKIFKWKIN